MLRQFFVQLTVLSDSSVSADDDEGPVVVGPSSMICARTSSSGQRDRSIVQFGQHILQGNW